MGVLHNKVANEHAGNSFAKMLRYWFMLTLDQYNDGKKYFFHSFRFLSNRFCDKYSFLFKSTHQFL